MTKTINEKKRPGRPPSFITRTNRRLNQIEADTEELFLNAKIINAKLEHTYKIHTSLHKAAWIIAIASLTSIILFVLSYFVCPW